MKNFFKIFLFDIFILLLLFLIFETGLRLFWKMSTLAGELYVASKNRTLRYELKPNAKAGLVSINSDGFRDREYPLEKPEGAFRIIVLGDSETLSVSLPLEDTLPKKIESVLNLICRQKKFEVFNMGVQGYNTIQELEMLKTKGLKYNPDLVILYYTFNDPDYPEYYFKKNFLNRNFLTARYLQYRIKKALIKRDKRLRHIVSDEEAFKYLYSAGCWDYTEDAIIEFNAACQQRGVRFVLAVNTEMSSAVSNFREGYPYWYINEKLAALQKYNIGVVDPTYLFRDGNYNKFDLTISLTDAYKNPRANSIIASYIADYLINADIFSCNSPEVLS